MPSSANGKQAAAAVSAVRSMTGYASIRAQTDGGDLHLSLRSVNHRGLDLHFHLANDIAPFENAMRDLLKQNIGRGHVEIRVTLNREQAGGTVPFNAELLRGYLSAFEQFKREFALNSKPDLNALLALPGVIDARREQAALADEFGRELARGVRPHVLPALMPTVNGRAASCCRR